MYRIILTSMLLAFSVTLGISRARAQQSPSPLAYRVYLIGDTGGANSPGSVASLQTLKQLISRESQGSAVVFLGDNIYCCGLPDSSSENRSQAEMRIDEALNAVDGFAGRTIFIPGNHDWGDAGSYDSETLLRQQKYVEDRLGENSFLPKDGLPGPIEVKLTDDIRLIVVDTQWWLLDEKSYGETGDYDIEEEGDFILAVRDLLARRDDENVLLVGHHPLISFGEHGGRFAMKDHLFPLTNLWEDAWIPLPIIGSLYPFSRSLVGGRQDLANKKYLSLRQSLLALFRNHTGNLIYASGHEHNLQHIIEGKTHLLVSGAGSRPSYVDNTRAAAFTSSKAGFMILDYFSDGSVSTRAISERGELLYESALFAESTSAGVETDFNSGADPFSGDGTRGNLHESVVAAITPSLSANWLKRSMMGSHHRVAWTTPFEADVFDVSTVEGGLRPLQKGGGLQTTSVRLEDAQGYQYVLRSIDKDASKTIPLELQKTLAKNIVRDQLAILQPFAALMVPPLAKAAGIYYSTPHLYYVPDDAGLAPFSDLVAGEFMLLERRPDDDMSAFPEFGYSEDVISAGKVYRELLDDNDNRVDSEFFARSRLFDMLISDWDRHIDQWRWASFDDPDGKGSLYRPIPRDRDWAFNRMNGFFPSIIKSNWVMPKFQDFRQDFGFIRGLNGNGMPQDRRFTSGMSRQQWVQIASDLRDSIEQDDMQEAVDMLPAEIKLVYEQEVLTSLASRLGQLPAVADEYYDILAALVDVVGSDKHELFTVTAAADSVEVKMSKTSKKGVVREEMYRRVFFAEETEEIRLYGLGGNDQFILRGTSSFPIRIYAIGGTGEDEFDDFTSGRVVKKNWFVRDTPAESIVRRGASTRDQLSSNPLVHDYNPSNYWFEALLPSFVFSSSQEDGVFLGAGLTHSSNVFHRAPFSTMHTVKASIATRSKAFTFSYEALFNQRFGMWGVLVSASARTQGNIQNFYGFGSNTKSPVSRESFYESDIEDYHIDLGFFREWDSGITIKTTTFIEFANVDQSEGGFATLLESGAARKDFPNLSHTGLSGTLEADRTDNTAYPLTGFRWSASVRTRIGLNQDSGDFTTLKSQLSYYFTPGIGRKTTLASRFGASHVGGDFPYFRSATVGDNSGLRGWRQDRFSGNTAAFFNLELRRELFTFSGLLAAGHGGINVFLDDARVFSDENDEGAWHQGVGGGVWLNFFDMSVFQISLSLSEEENYLAMGFGFEF